ncbi:MAG: methylated-DNA--[protein]-cysteine S-methyltransferase [Cyanomargarita calcarea GSE-NOS-MK-12-04C]|jgi:methylated-DNA-[protein]-cysteine S-methyltransferase|uniref:Methylated-DNA--protein-cysteine methyltransferase n=1 Tax=Cyanomargarita calcarea GSE-NOS-MK-12-04C TaxID=2839659 RepID=A0A951QUL2_9CYAN|nr:methylated-DNA--[protein]-cysteine S-methyltransferase [Cyanomargarita calcarea GSE-NOS-MK-12-04C]
MELLIDKISSEIGTILVVSDGEKLCALDFADYELRTIRLLQKRYKSFSLKKTKNPLGLSNRLEAYLKGDFTSLDDIAVSVGGTAFQQQVWLALRNIPCGTAISYGQLAAKIGKPTASRAVGMANSLNPVAIVLPCHRVIGANAGLTGYAGGLERKRWLLEHEGVKIAAFSQ